MQTTIKSTPSSWQVEHHVGDFPIRIVGPSRDLIAALPSIDYAYAIIHCVNTYPALVEALGALHPFVNPFHCGACRVLAFAKKGLEP